MRYSIRSIRIVSDTLLHHWNLSKVTYKMYYHNNAFLDFYKKITGETITDDYFQILKKRHPHIDEISHDRLQCTLQILQKFGITPEEACQHLHVFSMNPITMDNYGEILKECGFITISPNHIIKYHTLARSRTIAQLKKEGLLSQDAIIEQNILNQIKDWPETNKILQNFSDVKSSILMIRSSVLERYLFWKLSVSAAEFQSYSKNYLPLKHKPMSDIQEAINLALNDIQFDIEGVRRNGFVIYADPLHTKLLLENIKTLAGMDIREAIKMEPAILKNNYNSVQQIRDILEEYRISHDAQSRCLKVYCMRPETVRQRLEEFGKSKEYRILSTNPRVLYMVVHKNKMMARLNKIQTANKQCYSLNHLVSSNKVFNSYISSFGDKVCGRDIAVLITSSLKNLNTDSKYTELKAELLKKLRRHKYWLHVAVNVIDENIHFLKKRFRDETILDNCQLLLYPVTEVQHYINALLNLRAGTQSQENFTPELNYSTLKCAYLTDDQILSLVLYEIEKKYHFSCDGIWNKQDGAKADTLCVK